MKKIINKNFIIIFIVVLILLVLSIIYFNNYNIDNKENKTNITKFENINNNEERRKDLMENITLNYHSSIRIKKDNKIIYFDPFKIDDNKNDADYIFITHSHYDHYSKEDIKKVMNDNTIFIITSDINDLSSLGIKDSNINVVYPNKTYKVGSLSFDTIPSYNTNKTYHKKSYNWVGYNVNVDGIKYYIVGDSDVTEELKNVVCDVIFIPVGGTYTMTDSEASLAVNEMNVKYAVPIHYGEVGSSINANNFINNLNSNIKGIILK